MTNIEYLEVFFIFLIPGLLFLWILRKNFFLKLQDVQQFSEEIITKNFIYFFLGISVIYLSFEYLYLFIDYTNFGPSFYHLAYEFTIFLFVISYLKITNLTKLIYDGKKLILLGFFTFLASLPWLGLSSLISDYLAKTINIITHSTTEIKEQQISFDLISFIALQFSSILIVPIYEEIIFRGFIQNYLEKLIRASAILTSILFALVHYRVGQGLANIFLLLPIFVSSLFIGFLYQKTKSLSSCISFHVIHNLFYTTPLLLRKFYVFN